MVKQIPRLSQRLWPTKQRAPTLKGIKKILIEADRETVLAQRQYLFRICLLAAARTGANVRFLGRILAHSCDFEPDSLCK